jgi:putative peptidoglycan lipid II flippase
MSDIDRPPAGPRAPDDSAQTRVVRSAGAFGTATLASRALGMVRDMVIAAVFSAWATDAFFVAFTIPNVLRRLLGEGSLNAAVVPVYTEVGVRGSDRESVRFVRVMLGAWLLVLLLVCAAGVALAPWLVRIYAWGFADDPRKLELTVILTRVMFPYILFMGLVALSTGVLNVHGRFFVPAFSPFFWNLAMIASALLASGPLAARGVPPVMSIAAGVVLGGLLQVLWQLPALARVGRLVRPVLSPGDPELRKVARLMLPMTLGYGIYQVDVLLSRLFASFLPEGSVSYLYYGMRVVDLPQAVFLLAIGTAVLPELSRAAAEHRPEDLRRSYGRALGLSLFVALPATVGIVVLARPIVSVLFLRGRFDLAMLEQTSLALMCMAPGIVGTAGVRVTMPAFFAQADTRTPTVIGAVNLAVYVAACLALMGPLQHLGLALALSIAPLTQFGQLAVALRRRVGPLGLRSVGRAVARSSAGCAVMGGAVWLLARPGRWDDPGRIALNAVLLLGCVAAGAALYAAVTYLLGAPELEEIAAALRRRASRQGPSSGGGSG